MNRLTQMSRRFREKSLTAKQKGFSQYSLSALIDSGD